MPATPAERDSAQPAPASTPTPLPNVNPKQNQSTSRRETFAPVIGMPIACRVVESWCPDSTGEQLPGLAMPSAALPKAALAKATMPSMHPQKVGSPWTFEADPAAP